MRYVNQEAFGEPGVLAVCDGPDPVPPPDGYVVAVRAAGCNYADVVERRGRYRKDQVLPAVLGKEAAGVVVERGPRATRFEIGDPVIVVRFDNGCYAELVAAGPGQVLRPPRGYSFVEMAAFANCFATYWYAMHEIARVRPGDSVLVQAAAGGVGTAAVALARSHGCAPIIGTAGTPEKCSIVRGLGADACVDYSAADFGEVVLERTHGTGVDYCLESVGGDVYRRSLEVLAPMGRMVVIGFSSISADYATEIPRLHPLHLFHRSILVGGLNVDHLDYARRAPVWDRLVDHVELHGLRPHVGGIYPLSEVAAAHDALESRRTVGKVVLAVASSDGPTAAVHERPSPTDEVVLDLRDPVAHPS